MWWSAVVLGWIGSLHCVVMCGPLVEVMSRRPRQVWYHFGRLGTYGILGMILGFFGQHVALFSSQKILTLFAGIFLVALAIWPSRWATFSPLWVRWQAPWRKRFQEWRLRFPIRSELGMGSLNGLIPCGLLYAALAGAIQFQYTYQSGLYMILFGIGTLPALIGGRWVWGNIIGWFRRHVPFAIPTTYALMGFLLIWRATSLQIQVRSEGFPITICHAPATETSGESD